LTDGEVLANKTLILNVDGWERNITTNEYGIAEYQYTPTRIGLFNVSTRFDGDNYYYNSSANTTFNVDSIPPTPPPANITNVTNITNGELCNDIYDKFCDGLTWTGIPLVALVLTIIGGAYYYRKK